MNLRRGTLMWAALALAGLVVAVGVSFAASKLAEPSVGLTNEPVSAGARLAPTRTQTTEDRPARKQKRKRKRGGASTTPAAPPPATTRPVAPPPTSTSGDDHGGGSESGDDSGGHGRGRGRGGDDD